MKLLISSLVLLQIFNFGSCIKFYNLIIEKHETVTDEKLVTLSTKFGKNKDGDQTLSGSLKIQENLDDIIAHSTAYSLEKGKYESFYINTSVEACKFIERLKAQAVVKAILAELLKTTNMPLECPVKKGDYFVKNLVIPTDMIPPFIPEKSFKTHIIVNRLVDGVENLIMDTQWYWRLEKRSPLPF